MNNGGFHDRPSESDVLEALQAREIAARSRFPAADPDGLLIGP